jgi:hypothetical protein
VPSVVGSIDRNRCRHSISAWPHNSALLESCFRLLPTDARAEARKSHDHTCCRDGNSGTPTYERSFLYLPTAFDGSDYKPVPAKGPKDTGFWQSKRGRRLEKTITANCRKSGGLTRRYNPLGRWERAQTALGNNMPGRSAECSGDAGAPCLGKRADSPRRVESRVH